MVKLFAANPNDSEQWVELAARQAWFGQDSELAATRRRVLPLAKGTTDMLAAERAAKVCTVLPSTDKAEDEAGLTLGARRSNWARVGTGTYWPRHG